MPPPLGFVDRVPFPTLKNYVLMSFSSVTFGALFAWLHAKDYMSEALDISKNLTDVQIDAMFNTLTYTEYNQCLMLALTSQFWTVCTLINMCYCCMALFGKGIQLAVFGNLRVSEVQQLKEKFWNFVFYKFIFIFGVLNVQYMNEAFMWTAWYSLLCFFQLLAQLCKLRFDYCALHSAVADNSIDVPIRTSLMFCFQYFCLVFVILFSLKENTRMLSFTLSLSCSPATPKSQHVKLLFLLTLIFLASICLTATAVVAGLYTDWNVSGFLLAECLLLVVRTIYVLIKYTIYLVDINHEGLWETRGTIVYYTELTCEISMLLVDLLHYLHMVVWSNIFLSMASIVIWMQIRYLISEIRKRIVRHRSYLKIVKSMEERFTIATNEDIQSYDDNCAICWDKMQRARKLPCGHIFHSSCLRSWLAQDISCPTCRVNLGEEKIENPTVVNTEGQEGMSLAHRILDPQARQEVRRVNRTNHLFHFDASRYISWLPSFSVEVTHTQGQPRENVPLDTMAMEVHRVFPELSMTSILEDLRDTHSVEITIDNILEGRLVILSNGNDEVTEEGNESDDSHNSSVEQQGPDNNDIHSPQLDTPATASHEPSLSNDGQVRQRLLQDQKREQPAKYKQQLRLSSADGNHDAAPQDGKSK